MEVRKIYLSGSNGKGKYALVDADDFERLSKHAWHLGGNYAYRSARIRGRRTTLYMHREVLRAPTTEDDPRPVDHINGNGLDNRKENLRFVTPGQNCQNRHGAQVNSSTGVRGVFPFEGDKYRARIWVDGDSISLGLFDTIDEAEAAVIRARKKYMTHAPECLEVS